MQRCHQSPDETIWQHCQSVAGTYFDILQHPDKHPLPEIIRQKWNLIIANQIDSGVVRQYLEWHDCGKPFCETVSNGRTSFPNHAAISERMFREAGGSDEAARLIGLDMIFHLTKPSEILEQTATLDRRTLCTLMLSAWAAIFANAKMFGGADSESFKIKQSQLIARCKKVLAAIDKPG